MIETQLEKKFPKKINKFLILSGKIDKPELILQPGQEKIIVDLQVKMKILTFHKPLEYDFGVRVKTGLAYNAQDYSLYLKDCEIEELKLPKIKKSILKKITKYLKPAVQELLNNQAVYQLPSKDFKEDLARLLLKEVRIGNEEIQVIIGL